MEGIKSKTYDQSEASLLLKKFKSSENIKPEEFASFSPLKRKKPQPHHEPNILR